MCLWVRFVPLHLKSAGKVLMICGIFGFWACFKIAQSQASQNLAYCWKVQILTDTIKVTVDSLSFRKIWWTHFFYYKLQSEEEKSLQTLTDLWDRTRRKLSEPEGREIWCRLPSLSEDSGIYQTLNIKKNPVPQKSAVWIGENCPVYAERLVSIKTHFQTLCAITRLLLGHLDTDFEDMNRLYSSQGSSFLPCRACR